MTYEIEFKTITSESRLVRSPSDENKKRWGPLAFVDHAERRRIMELPVGQFKSAVKALEKEIAYEKKMKRL